MEHAAYLAWLFLLMRVILLVPAYLALHFAWSSVGSMLQIELGVDVYWVSIAYVTAFLVGKQAGDTLQAVMCHREASMGYAFDAISRLVILGGLALAGTITLQQALWSYVAGAAIGALVCIVGMLRLFSRMSSPFGAQAQGGLRFDPLVQYGWHAYLHNVSGILMTPQALRIFCAALLGAAGVAALGFAQSMAEFVKRYLPVNFLTSMIEPALIGRYRETKDFAALNALASVIFKANLFLLLPFVGWLTLSGEGALALVTGGKYLDQIWLLSGLLALLVLDAHRALLHIIIMAIDKTWLLVMSQFWPTVMLAGLLPLVFFQGLAGLLAGLFVIALFVNAYLVRQLEKGGYAYQCDWQGIGRVMINAAVANTIGLLGARVADGWAGSLLALAVMVIAYLGICYGNKVFGIEERNLINRLIGRPLWVW